MRYYKITYLDKEYGGRYQNIKGSAYIQSTNSAKCFTF